MSIVLELQKKDSLNRGYDRDLSALYIRIGVTHLKRRDFPSALAAFQQSAALYEKQIAADSSNTIVLRDSAIAYRHAGAANEELSKTADRQVRRAHLAAARENYLRALDALVKAQDQKALPEVNRKLLEAVRKDIQKLDALQRLL